MDVHIDLKFHEEKAWQLRLPIEVIRLKQKLIYELQDLIGFRFSVVNLKEMVNELWTDLGFEEMTLKEVLLFFEILSMDG